MEIYKYFRENGILMERTSLEIIISQILACVFVLVLLASLHRRAFIKIQKKIIAFFGDFQIFTVVPAIILMTTFFCRTIIPSLRFNTEMEASKNFQTYWMMISFLSIALMRLGRGCLVDSEKSADFNIMVFNILSVVGKLSLCLSLYMIHVYTFDDRIMLLTAIISFSLIDFARLGLDEVKRRELQNNE